MPLLKCCKCHHEWEGSKSSKCDWCGASGKILEEKTSLERMSEEWAKSGLPAVIKSVLNGCPLEKETLPPKDTPKKEDGV